jgi:acetyltransferase-like isoleucine patch superfamily enzyme
MQTAFDHNFFKHLNDSRIKEGLPASTAFSLVGKLMAFSPFKAIVFIFEWITGFILALPVPLYSTVVYLIITHLPGLPSFAGMYLRSIYYRRKLKRMESNVLIDHNVFFAFPDTVELSAFSYIDKNVTIMSKTCKIGRRVHLAPGVFVSGGGHFEIEDYACIATGSKIITSTEVLQDGARCSGPMADPQQRNVFRSQVLIKKDAFIGANVTVLPGVTVEQGSVAAAGITLTKDTEPWGIYLGSRATKVKVREQVKWEDN